MSYRAEVDQWDLVKEGMMMESWRSREWNQADKEWRRKKEIGLALYGEHVEKIFRKNGEEEKNFSQVSHRLRYFYKNSNAFYFVTIVPHDNHMHCRWWPSVSLKDWFIRNDNFWTFCILKGKHWTGKRFKGKSWTF